MILALAGRRIDDPKEKVESFPIKNIESVRAKLKTLFIFLKPSVLVCSGSCGADLLALEVAGELGIPRNMVIPFSPRLFKSRSVEDRPGDWAAKFDRLYEEIAKEEKVLIMNYPSNDADAYRKTNVDILNRAQILSENSGENKDVRAVIVWESGNKGDVDTSAHFKNEAKQRGIRIEEIDTLK
jgi:hypothetical protein